MAKLVTYAELKEHRTKDSLYILLHEKGTSLCYLVPPRMTAHCQFPRAVYDVTKFIDEVCTGPSHTSSSEELIHGESILEATR